MIKNELLPGCAVLVADPNEPDREYIWDSHSSKYDNTYGYKLNPIPLTAESVAKVEGYCGKMINHNFLIDGEYMKKDNITISVDLIDGKVYSRNENGKDTDVTIIRRKPITSIHQLQILIYSLTGTMPKYDVG